MRTIVRSEQPDSKPIRIPDERENPAVIPQRRSTPAPQRPVRVPEKVPAKTASRLSREVLFCAKIVP
jgi:hypothetical protein